MHCICQAVGNACVELNSWQETVGARPEVNVRSPSIKFILTFRNTFILFSLLMVDETVHLNKDGKPEKSTRKGREPIE